MHVNLLPRSFIWRRVVSKRLRQWGWTFALLVLLGLGLNLGLFSIWWSKTRELPAAQASAKPVLQMQSVQLELASRIAELEKRITQVKSVLSPDRTCSVLSIIAQGVRSADHSVQIQESQFTINTKTMDGSKSSQEPRRNSNPPPSDATSGKDVAFGIAYQLTLRGIAAEGESITEFVKSIQQSTAFPVVELRSSHERVVSERLLQEFQLECLSHE